MSGLPPLWGFFFTRFATNFKKKKGELCAGGRGVMESANAKENITVVGRHMMKVSTGAE